MLPKFPPNRLLAMLDPTLDDDGLQAEILVDAAGIYPGDKMISYLTENPPSPRVIYALMCKAQERLIIDRATAAANAGHDQLGGSRDKRAKLLEIYLRDYKPKGKTKSACIDNERGKLGMSQSTGEKALRNK